MNKLILSVFIMAAAIIAAAILFNAVITSYPTFGEFYNLLYLGLVTLGLGLALFISGLLLEKSIKEKNNS